MEQFQDELLDKYPYMQELARRIDDINSDINRGGGGLEQAKNFISDLPEEWVNEIKPRLDKEYSAFRSKYNTIFSSGLSWRTRDRKLIECEREISRTIKSVGIGLLNSKKILFAKRSAVETNMLSGFDEGVTDDE